MIAGRLEGQGFRIAIAALAFVVWAGFTAIHAPEKAADFYVFWTAGRHTAAPYDPAIIAALQAQFHISGQVPFAYPPTFLLLIWPFAQAPLAIAYPLWTGLSAAVFFYAAAHLVRPAWLALALFIAPPVVLAIAPGQTSLMVGGAMIGGWLTLKDRPALAGVLFAVAACIKPQAMLLAPIVLWGHWRAMRWALIAALGLVLASLVFGPELWLQWPKALTRFSHIAPGTNRINPSALLDATWVAAPLALLGVWLAWRWRDLTGLIAGGLCLTPYAHQYDLAPLAPIALSWLADYKRQGFGRAAAGAALLAGLVATPLAGLALVLGLAGIPLWRWRDGRQASPALVS
jgi:alpha-1,2-mannosyltransferase